MEERRLEKIFENKKGMTYMRVSRFHGKIQEERE